MEKQKWDDVKKTLDNIPSMKKKEAIKSLTSIVAFMLQKITVFYEKAILEERSKDLHEES